MRRRLAIALSGALGAHLVVLALLAALVHERRITVRPAPEGAMPIQVLLVDDAEADEPVETRAVAETRVVREPREEDGETDVAEGGNAEERQRGAATGGSSAPEPAPEGTHGSSSPAQPGHADDAVAARPSSGEGPVLRLDFGEPLPPPGPPDPLTLRPPPFVRMGKGPSDSPLESSGGGRYRIEDGPFTVHVDRDGTVELEDHRNLSVDLPTRRSIGDHLRAWQKDPYGVSQGRVMPAPPGGVPTLKVVGGGFDVTDAVMRAGGEDPYSARKLRALDDSRDERAGIALVNRSQDLRDSIAHLRRDLQRIIASRDRSPEDKRRLLFQLWDECAEDGPSDIVQAADMARATIVTAACRHFAPGSDGGYTDDELERLNAGRTSKARFAPCS